jgi:hypothetical protein
LKHIIKPVVRNQLTYAELHSASVGPRKDHIILVFRQSGKQADFHDTYADKVWRISTTTAPNHRTITANETAAVAVLSSKICKARLMPFFASNPETEMRLARQTDLITGDISYEDTRKHDKTRPYGRSRNAQYYQSAPRRQSSRTATCPCLDGDEWHIQQLAAVQRVRQAASRVV